MTRLQQTSTSVAQNKPNGFRRAVRAVKRSARRFAGRAVLVAALALGGFALYSLLPSKAHAEEPKQPEKGLSVRAFGGVYDKGQTPFGGFGASGHLGFKHVKIDALFDVMFPKLRSSELDTAELDITFPISQYFAFTPFVYSSRYYGDVPVGAGVAFHIPKLNLHVAPHWCSGNNAVPLPIFWTPSIGNGRLNILLKVIPILNHGAMQKPAPLVGGEIMLSMKVYDGVRIYGRVFEMLAKDGEGRVFVGAANAQAGLEMDF
jgi:hypothetical protein